MEFKVKTGDPTKLRGACMVLGVCAKRRLSDPAKAIDKASGGLLSRLLKKGDMDGDPEQTLMLHEIPGIACPRILLVGCGKAKEFYMANYRKVAGAAVTALARQRIPDALWMLHEPLPGDADAYRTVRETVLIAEERTYRFNRMKSKPEPPKRPLKHITFRLADKRQQNAAAEAIRHGRAVAQGVTLARDLGNLPSNVCTPTYLAEQAVELGQRSPKLHVKVLEEKEMEELGMGALLAVSRGSRQLAKLIVLEYQGAGDKDKPVVLVGKGLTFDAGGISLKPGKGMDEMKYDMCGGAAVLGIISTCLGLDLPINLVGIIPSSENLPDGNAYKPGDVITSMSGKTIEIINTDAEGRLILCDAITYSHRFNPSVIIDIATLTGACMVALGKHISGLFSNNCSLSDALKEAGDSISDPCWPLPMAEEYDNEMNGQIADIRNLGSQFGGAITAACFLSRFVDHDSWAHIDIAGSAWTSGKTAVATGRPVALLSQYLINLSLKR